jgi:hypothetical protein
MSHDAGNFQSTDRYMCLFYLFHFLQAPMLRLFTLTIACYFLCSLSAGANLALAKSGAGQQLDLINVMSYGALTVACCFLCSLSAGANLALTVTCYFLCSLSAGANLALAKSGARQQLDLIMSSTH